MDMEEMPNPFGQKEPVRIQDVALAKIIAELGNEFKTMLTKRILCKQDKINDMKNCIVKEEKDLKKMETQR